MHSVEPTLGAIVGPHADHGLGTQTAICTYTDTGDLTVEATGPDGAAVDLSVTAHDVVDPAPLLECDPTSGTTLPLGTYPVACSATDAVGNSASGGVAVTVVDTTPPVCSTFPRTSRSRRPARPARRSISRRRRTRQRGVRRLHHLRRRHDRADPRSAGGFRGPDQRFDRDGRRVHRHRRDLVSGEVPVVCDPAFSRPDPRHSLSTQDSGLRTQDSPD